MTLTLVNPTAMIFFCIFIFACIPWVIAALALAFGSKAKFSLNTISILFALAGWAFGYAFFSTP